MSFLAKSRKDLLTLARTAGRRDRQDFHANSGITLSHVVHVETYDGTWIELDADCRDHAVRLADNWVEFSEARGCSVWAVKADGKLAKSSDYLRFAEYGEDDNG